MKALSELQLDALAELFNIGAGRAAASLSEIVHEEVQLSVPVVHFYNTADITPELLAMNSPRLGMVKQQFSGEFSAKAMLLFTEERSMEIVRDMMGSSLSSEQLAEYEQEAMCELGNIILNACLSSMADVLAIPLQGSLPDYVIDSSELIIQRIVAEQGEPVLLVLHIDLRIEKRQSNGYLVFLLSTASLQSLMSRIDQFLAGA